ncbi:hypothetical protein [Akkermansia sp.]|uniref:hypothetical protein n=1 Tax=Akkermansia sp. TaxID=1872421 RepID=UPI003AB6CE4D
MNLPGGPGQISFGVNQGVNQRPFQRSQRFHFTCEVFPEHQPGKKFRALISVDFPAILVLKRTGFPQQQPLLPVSLAQITLRIKNGYIAQICFHAGSAAFPVTAANLPASEPETLKNIQILFLGYRKTDGFCF